MCGGTCPICLPALKTWVRPSRACHEPPLAHGAWWMWPQMHDVRLVLLDPGGELVVGELAPAVAAQHGAGRGRVVDPHPRRGPVDGRGRQLGVDLVAGQRCRPTTGRR